jgi:CRISPR/Cas system-associated exonuclease Cas4 (RecB family)
MLKEKIDALYTSKQETRDKLAFYISDAGKCPRAIWFAMKKYPKKEVDARTMRIFEHGNHTHMRIMAALYSLGMVTASEIGIPDNQVIHGRADAIVNIDGELYVLEIKSVNSMRFRKGEADPDHIKQLQLYLYFFNIKKGILLYENKDNQEIKEFIIEYNEPLVKKLFADFNVLKDQVEKSQVPEIPGDLEDWRCEYCSYLEACEKIEEKEQKE